MNKVLSISNDVISIGLANGSLMEVRKEDLNFEPRVGDVVDVFQNETKTTVVLAEKSATNSSSPIQDGSGINISINNDHSNSGPAQPTYVVAGKVVNKTVYALLAIFLGGLGIHKFYAGKFGAGVVYIIFAWTFIPAFIGFFEGIFSLMKPADANGNIIC